MLLCLVFLLRYFIKVYRRLFPLFLRILLNPLDIYLCPLERNRLFLMFYRRLFILLRLRRILEPHEMLFFLLLFLRYFIKLFRYSRPYFPPMMSDPENILLHFLRFFRLVIIFNRHLFLLLLCRRILDRHEILFSPFNRLRLFIKNSRILFLFCPFSRNLNPC